MAIEDTVSINFDPSSSIVDSVLGCCVPGVDKEMPQSQTAEQPWNHEEETQNYKVKQPSISFLSKMMTILERASLLQNEDPTQHPHTQWEPQQTIINNNILTGNYPFLFHIFLFNHFF